MARTTCARHIHPSPTPQRGASPVNVDVDDEVDVAVADDVAVAVDDEVDVPVDDRVDVGGLDGITVAVMVLTLAVGLAEAERVATAGATVGAAVFVVERVGVGDERTGLADALAVGLDDAVREPTTGAAVGTDELVVDVVAVRVDDEAGVGEAVPEAVGLDVAVRVRKGGSVGAADGVAAAVAAAVTVAAPLPPPAAKKAVRLTIVGGDEQLASDTTVALRPARSAAAEMGRRPNAAAKVASTAA